MRKLAWEYLLANGSFTGLQNSDVGVGSGAEQLPATCNSSYWYEYHSWVSGSGYLALYSFRCLSGGKPPQGTQKCGWRVTMYPDGSEGWYCVGPDGTAACPGGC
ncbi:MAG: hypothetical protein PHP10_03325 [Candidatus Omnitrophica bacterium]|nr:hypothetical protein [Candidatus Omnitrophota bacterium]